MSTTELIPLFPSATHPALPIASQILSTLRQLTAPGKGNDLKPEEGAALVGVSALLGCERVQSKDLIEKSAQKASSVSPAHFRSALNHARRILSTVSLPESPSRRSSSRASSSTSTSEQPSPSTQKQKQAVSATISPFQTPKKKFKYTSGVDLSGLVRSPHEPIRGSPLKQSVTPSKLRDRLILREDEDAEEREDDEELVHTPTKRVKYATRPGVDLELQTETGTAVAEWSGRGSGKRKREDAAAFFALRPGSVSGSTRITSTRQRSPVHGDGLPELQLRVRRERVKRLRKEKKVVPRRDWTYSESLWGSDEIIEANSRIMDQIMADLPSWLELHNRPPLSETPSRGSTLLEILSSSTRLHNEELDATT